MWFSLSIHLKYGHQYDKWWWRGREETSSILNFFIFVIHVISYLNVFLHYIMNNTFLVLIIHPSYIDNSFSPNNIAHEYHESPGQWVCMYCNTVNVSVSQRFMVFLVHWKLFQFINCIKTIYNPETEWGSLLKIVT